MEIALVLIVGGIIFWYVHRSNAVKAELAKAQAQQRTASPELFALAGEAEREWEAAVSDRNAAVRDLLWLYNQGIPNAVFRHARDAVARGPLQGVAPLLEHQATIEESLSYRELSLDEAQKQEVRAIDAAVHGVDERYKTYESLTIDIDRALRSEQLAFSTLREVAQPGSLAVSRGVEGLVRLKDATAKLAIQAAETKAEERRLLSAVARQQKLNKGIFPDVSPWVEDLDVLREVCEALRKGGFTWPPS